MRRVLRHSQQKQEREQEPKLLLLLHLLSLLILEYLPTSREFVPYHKKKEEEKKNQEEEEEEEAVAGRERQHGMALFRPGGTDLADYDVLLVGADNNGGPRKRDEKRVS
ncbi:hypothetical protein M0804_000254 [Polistes exclamans]|nr:hypothetical protein M0804_000254 [Polistes exclamans]